MENNKSNIISFKKKADEKFKKENEVILTLEDDESTEFVFEMDLENEDI